MTTCRLFSQQTANSGVLCSHLQRHVDRVHQKSLADVTPTNVLLILILLYFVWFVVRDGTNGQVEGVVPTTTPPSICTYLPRYAPAKTRHDNRPNTFVINSAVQVRRSLGAKLEVLTMPHMMTRRFWKGPMPIASMVSEKVIAGCCCSDPWSSSEGESPPAIACISWACVGDSIRMFDDILSALCQRRANCSYPARGMHVSGGSELHSTRSCWDQTAQKMCEKWKVLIKECSLQSFSPKDWSVGFPNRKDRVFCWDKFGIRNLFF